MVNRHSSNLTMLQWKWTMDLKWNLVEHSCVTYSPVAVWTHFSAGVMRSSDHWSTGIAIIWLCGKNQCKNNIVGKESIQKQNCFLFTTVSGISMVAASRGAVVKLVSLRYYKPIWNCENLTCKNVSDITSRIFISHIFYYF